MQLQVGTIYSIEGIEVEFVGVNPCTGLSVFRVLGTATRIEMRIA